MGVDFRAGRGDSGDMMKVKMTTPTLTLTQHSTHNHKTGRGRVILERGKLTPQFRPSDREAILKPPPGDPPDQTRGPVNDQKEALRRVGHRLPFVKCPYCEEYQLHVVNTMELGHALWCYCCGWKKA